MSNSQYPICKRKFILLNQKKVLQIKRKVFVREFLNFFQFLVIKRKTKLVLDKIQQELMVIIKILLLYLVHHQLSPNILNPNKIVYTPNISKIVAQKREDLSIYQFHNL